MRTNCIPRNHKFRSAFTLVELLVVIAIIGILVALLLPAVQSARESARRLTCSNHLKQIGLGLLLFESAKGHLPAAEDHGTGSAANMGGQGFYHCGWGVNVGKWATHIFPYMEQQPAYDLLNFDIEWQTRDDGNVSVLQMEMPFYQCPSDPYRGLTRVEDFLTERHRSRIMHYYAVAGAFRHSDPFYDPGVMCNGHDCCQHLGTFYNDSNTRLRKIRDGLSKTSFVSEVWGRKARNHDSGEPSRGIGWHNQTYYDILPNVRIRCPNTDSDSLQCAEPHRPNSFHPAGVDAVFGDGSVHLIPNEIDMKIYQGYATINGDDNLDERLRELLSKGWPDQ